MKTFRRVSVVIAGLLAICLQPKSCSWGQSAAEEVSAVETLPAPRQPDQPQPADAAADALGTYSILRQPDSASDSNESPAASSLFSLPGSPLPLRPDEDISSEDWDGIDQYDVLSRGPMHEAFAQPPSAYATSPLRFERPPEAIQEIPPGDVPLGNNVQWINGYWGWNEDLSDYVWVTGIYRDVPPGREWVAGYWANMDGGYRWIGGYWAAAGRSDVRYLPAPPDLEGGQLSSGQSPLRGPTSAAVSEDSFWLPGHWSFVGGQYKWQKGYWTKQYANWIWTPANYVSTPQGYVFVSGYWDYEPTFRGRIYAPIVFRTADFLRRDYQLQPIYPLVEPAALIMHLFVLPDSPQYYFGNFYSNRFTAQGFRPWYVASTTYATASMLSYYQWKYGRANAAFKDSMLDYYQFLRNTPAARPAGEFIAAQRPNEVSNLASAAIPTLDSVALRRMPWEEATRLPTTRVPAPGGPNNGAPLNGPGNLGPVRSASAARQSPLQRPEANRISGASNNTVQRLGQSNPARMPAGGNNVPEQMRSTRSTPPTNSTANSALQSQPNVSPFPGRPLLSRIYQAAAARGALPPGFAPPGVSPPGITPLGVAPPGGLPGLDARRSGGILRGRRGR